MTTTRRRAVELDPAVFGARLREGREARGLTQEALAAAAGVSHQTVYQLETGRKLPLLSVAVCLAHALDVTVDSLAAQHGPLVAPAMSASSPAPGALRAGDGAGFGAASSAAGTFAPDRPEPRDTPCTATGGAATPHPHNDNGPGTHPQAVSSNAVG